MLLGELLLRRQCVKLEIDELREYMLSSEDVENVNDILNKLFKSEDQLQKHNILIDRANNEVEVAVGNSKTSVANVIRLKKSIDRKIGVLTKLIKSNKKSLNIINLMEQRQKLIEEYILLSNAITKSDWSTDID